MYRKEIQMIKYKRPSLNKMQIKNIEILLFHQLDYQKWIIWQYQLLGEGMENFYGLLMGVYVGSRPYENNLIASNKIENIPAEWLYDL